MTAETITSTIDGPIATITNNNWKDTQETEIQATGIAPTNDLESAIVKTLDPGAYTAILAGNAGSTGVGLFEIYDLSTNQDSRLANMSTRANVGTDDDIVDSMGDVALGVIDIVSKGSFYDYEYGSCASSPTKCTRHSCTRALATFRTRLPRTPPARTR